MKKLLVVAVALVLLLLSNAAALGPMKWTMLGTSLVLSFAVLIHGIIVRRRRGQRWNEALAGNTKLLTGNVWLDGAVFAAVLVACAAAVVLLMLYA